MFHCLWCRELQRKKGPWAKGQDTIIVNGQVICNVCECTIVYRMWKITSTQPGPAALDPTSSTFSLGGVAPNPVAKVVLRSAEDVANYPGVEFEEGETPQKAPWTKEVFKGAVVRLSQQQLQAAGGGDATAEGEGQEEAEAEGGGTATAEDEGSQQSLEQHNLLQTRKGQGPLSRLSTPWGSIQKELRQMLRHQQQFNDGGPDGRAFRKKCSDKKMHPKIHRIFPDLPNYSPGGEMVNVDDFDDVLEEAHRVKIAACALRVQHMNAQGVLADVRIKRRIENMYSGIERLAPRVKYESKGSRLTAVQQAALDMGMDLSEDQIRKAHWAVRHGEELPNAIQAAFMGELPEEVPSDEEEGGGHATAEAEREEGRTEKRKYDYGQTSGGTATATPWKQSRHGGQQEDWSWSYTRKQGQRQEHQYYQQSQQQSGSSSSGHWSPGDWSQHGQQQQQDVQAPRPWTRQQGGKGEQGKGKSWGSGGGGQWRRGGGSWQAWGAAWWTGAWRGADSAKVVQGQGADDFCTMSGSGNAIAETSHEMLMVMFILALAALSMFIGAYACFYIMKQRRHEEMRLRAAMLRNQAVQTESEAEMQVAANWSPEMVANRTAGEAGPVMRNTMIGSTSHPSSLAQFVDVNDPTAVVGLTPPPMQAPRMYGGSNASAGQAPASSSVDDEADSAIARAWGAGTLQYRYCTARGNVVHLFQNCNMNRHIAMERRRLCLNCQRRAEAILSQAVFPRAASGV